MELGFFQLDRPAVWTWLEDIQAKRPGAPGTAGWDPLEFGSEREVMELLTSAQRRRLLTGPAEVTLIYIDDPNGDVYHVVVEVKAGGDDRVLRLVSTACDWEMIAPGQQTGIEATVAILETITTKANALLREPECFAAPYEKAAYERAVRETLDITDGIEAHDTCSCGEPIAKYEDSWFHLYNDRLRGSDDHDPAPS